MRLHVAKDSPLSVHQQLRQQIIFFITTGELPIGSGMPSLGQLARALKLHRNTIDRLYDELVAQRWLCRQKGGRPPIVAYPKPPQTEVPGESIETLIDRLVIAARAKAVSLDEIIAKLRERGTEHVPDHFLVVEPEPGIGEVLKYEVQQATGKVPVSYSVSQLRSHPALLRGAALLVPAYLADLLDFVPPAQRSSMILLIYSPFGGYVDKVRKLAEPCLVGMISVTGAGMKTMSGVFAEAIGSRHHLIPFFMPWPPTAHSKVVIKKLGCEELPADIDVRRTGLETLGESRDKFFNSGWHTNLPLATRDDLLAVDVLFCDSITRNHIRHPRSLHYHLLSKESLQLISKVQLAKTSAMTH
jgi:DNA-binding transcriptional regulator YhcF (GntR family)